MAITVLFFFQLDFTPSYSLTPSLLLIGLISLTLVITTLVVQHGLTLVPAVKASPIFLFEIIVAGISAYFLANEVINLKDLLGGVFIVTGILISTRQD